MAEGLMGRFELFACVCMSLNSSVFLVFQVLLFDLLLWIFDCAVFLFFLLVLFCSVLVG